MFSGTGTQKGSAGSAAYYLGEFEARCLDQAKQLRPALAGLPAKVRCGRASVVGTVRGIVDAEIRREGTACLAIARPSSCLQGPCFRPPCCIHRRPLLHPPPLLPTPLRLSSPTLRLPRPANPSPRPPLRVAMRLFCGCFRDCAAGQRLSRFLHFRLEKRHRFWCHFSAPEIGQPVCAHGRPLLGGASQAPKSGLVFRVGKWTWFRCRKTAQG